MLRASLPSRQLCQHGGNALTNQRKIGRPRAENPMVRTAVVLPPQMLERLRSEAEASDQGVSAEIRRRLQMTYDQEGLPSDAQTTDLIKSIKKLADNLARDLGVQWYKHEFALKAFKAGIAVFLGQYDAEGDARPDTPFFGHPDDAPHDVVGQTHARLIVKERDDTPPG